MKSMVTLIHDHETYYTALFFVCPGCKTFGEYDTGLHLLPVNSHVKKPSWEWDGNIERPTLSPSILTSTPVIQLPGMKVIIKSKSQICHSFLSEGRFQFLNDSTHSLAGQTDVEMPDLPFWIVEDHGHELG